MSWVKVREIPGGQLVLCGLCGTKQSRRSFYAENTNYAEALRLAIAYAWNHEHSEVHHLAAEAFHEEKPPESAKEESLLMEIFGTAPPTERERRKSYAQSVARLAVRQGISASKAREGGAR